MAKLWTQCSSTRKFSVCSTPGTIWICPAHETLGMSSTWTFLVCSAPKLSGNVKHPNFRVYPPRETLGMSSTQKLWVCSAPETLWVCQAHKSLWVYAAPKPLWVCPAPEILWVFLNVHGTVDLMMNVSNDNMESIYSKNCYYFQYNEMF